MNLLAASQRSPNTSGLPGISELDHIVGALLTIGLVASLAGLVHLGDRVGGRQPLRQPLARRPGQDRRPCAFVAAALTGGAVTLINFFAGAGAHL